MKIPIFAFSDQIAGKAKQKVSDEVNATIRDETNHTTYWQVAQLLHSPTYLTIRTALISHIYGFCRNHTYVYHRPHL